jgi:large subunit ribosomal protein L13
LCLPAGLSAEEAGEAGTACPFRKIFPSELLDYKILISYNNKLNYLKEGVYSMNPRTYLAKTGEIQRQWHMIDAGGMVLGRLATKVADLLRGKGKRIFSNDVDCGDFVIITNASKIVLTGNKLEQKIAYRHSGYPGGDKYTPYKRLMLEAPEKAMESAVKGMLPKNKLAARQLKRLKIYKDAAHPHAAQLAKPSTKTDKI